jgi:hypothetical protein|nr:MAG TPA: hypothetical protein [Caudoviricetes sp.]
MLVIEDIEEVVEETEEKQSFQVTDLTSANWCFKKIKQVEYRKKQMEEYVHNEIKRIKEFHLKEEKNLNDEIDYFKFLLKEYIEKQQEVDPKFKISTVDGTASFGNIQQKIKYDDEVMLEFCKQNKLDKFIKTVTTEKLNKKEFNSYLNIVGDKVITVDGEVLENVNIEEFRNFNVKTK